MAGSQVNSAALLCESVPDTFEPVWLWQQGLKGLASPLRIGISGMCIR